MRRPGPPSTGPDCRKATPGRDLMADPGVTLRGLSHPDANVLSLTQLSKS